MDMVNFKRTVMAWSLMLTNFSSIKMKGKNVTLQKLRHYTSLKFHHIYGILCTNLQDHPHLRILLWDHKYYKSG